VNEKSIVIVGAGMAGLSSGRYSRMNGYKATTLEMNSIPGGLCTAWTRKGYTFDISMHMLTGSKSGPFHEMWREPGDLRTKATERNNVAKTTLLHACSTEALGLAVIRPTQTLPRCRTADVVVRQLLRAATSVGANYRAACRGQSPSAGQRMKLVNTVSSRSGNGTPASIPAFLHFRNQAMFFPNMRIICIPSRSFLTSSGVEP